MAGCGKIADYIDRFIQRKLRISVKHTVSLESGIAGLNRPAQIRIPVSYTHLDVYKRQVYLHPAVGLRDHGIALILDHIAHGRGFGAGILPDI